MLENFGVVVGDKARFRHSRAVSRTERGALKTIFELTIVPNQVHDSVDSTAPLYLRSDSEDGLEAQINRAVEGEDLEVSE